ncbi:unnamed protein product [Linum tenue]|uniref:Uncharacterized protein n=1 Tax=Linum tenue TaxID=586396 RepID=A0AAV0JFH5_9ROSI|nr:unnamed protein product [Linum tenue]
MRLETCPRPQFSKRFLRPVFEFPEFCGNVVSLRDPVGDVVGKISYIDNEGSDELDCELFGKVIKYALSHDTHHLVVDTNSTSCSCDYSFSDLFGTISSCNLTTLELQSVLIDEAFAHSGFGMLTTLNLELCELEYDLDEYLDPLSGCPCLQNLVLNHCSHFVKISGPQLLRLTLDCVYCDPWEQIEISAPRLKFLSLLPELEDMKFSKLSIPCLDHVDIRVTDMNDFLEGNEECVAQRFISLFEYLNNAISLTLGPHTIRVLSGMTEFLEQQPSSPFRRLKTLIMEADSVPYALINYFLKGSSMKPNLEFV